MTARGAGREIISGETGRTEDATVGVTIRIKRGESARDLPIPSYATPGSAGLDVRSAEDLDIEPGERASVGTGIYLEIPPGFEGQARPRSGLALKHGVTLLNSPGTIDSDYRGEIRMIMINLGRKKFSLKRGNRIAQIVFTPCTRAEIIETDELNSTARSSGGFGSTGVV